MGKKLLLIALVSKIFFVIFIIFSSPVFAENEKATTEESLYEYHQTMKKNMQNEFIKRTGNKNDFIKRLKEELNNVEKDFAVNTIKEGILFNFSYSNITIPQK